MPRIFITGSTDGLGRAAAGVLISEGHDVVLHARTRERAAALSDLAADWSWLPVMSRSASMISSPARSHGSGCAGLGSPAKPGTEGRLALGSLLYRFPELRLAVSATAPYWGHGDGLVLRGLSELLVIPGPHRISWFAIEAGRRGKE